MKIVLTPDWFLTADVLIETFSFIILFLFFMFSVKSYKLSKKKNSLYLGIGFLIIALAEIATILTKLVLYYDTTLTQSIGLIIITRHIVQTVDIFYYVGFFLHKFFTLLGFYIIYRISLKRNYFGDFFLALIFIIISALFGNSFYYIFHIVALALLILIVNNYYNIYRKNKSENTRILIIAFFMLALSQIIFILSTLKTCYVIAQVIQLVSYIILLILIIKILKLQNSYSDSYQKFRFLKHGRKKKNKNRNNL